MRFRSGVAACQAKIAAPTEAQAPGQGPVADKASRAGWSANRPEASALLA